MAKAKSTKSPAQRDAEIKGLLESLENGVNGIYTSDDFKRFLDLQAAMHHYSWNNIILAWAQYPQLSMISGFNTWKKFNRHVRKGEKAIKILAPRIAKVDEETTVNGEKVKTGEKVSRIVGFLTVSVFDIAQTDGEPLPMHAAEPQTSSEEGQQLLNALLEVIDIPVVFGEVGMSGAYGVYNRKRNDITVKDGMPADMTATTLVHEYIHSLLHNGEAADLNEKSRGQRETEAEGTSYVICKHLGLPVGQFSFEYIAGWANKEGRVELIKKVGDTIQKTARKVIDQVEAIIGTDVKDEEIQQGA